MTIKNITNDNYHFFLTDEFSQWYPSKFIDNEGIAFICCEQFMMYKKAELFNDKDIMKKILETDDPDIMKKLGREVKNFNPQKWDEEAFDIVTKGNFLKFSQNSDLANILLSLQGKTIVEAAGYDKIWGIGLYAEDAVNLTEKDWLGENKLGQALMKVQRILSNNLHFIKKESLLDKKIFTFVDKKGQKNIRLNINELCEHLNSTPSTVKDSLQELTKELSLEYKPFVKTSMVANKEDLLKSFENIEIDLVNYLKKITIKI